MKRPRQVRGLLLWNYNGNMKFTNCIAIGVGKGKAEDAATFFVEHLGGVRGKASEDWIEIKAGPIDFYLVEDEFGTPTFDVTVDNIDAGTESLVAAGCREIDLGLTSGERAVQTPFGMHICISQAL
jgi:hypothetical protein